MKIWQTHFLPVFLVCFERTISSRELIEEILVTLSILAKQKKNHKTITSSSTYGPEVMKLFSCSSEQSMEFILLINVKMPPIVDNCWHFNVYLQDKYNT